MFWGRGQILEAEDARVAARRVLPQMVYQYLDGGQASLDASGGNRTALDAVKLVPKALRNVTDRCARVRLFDGLEFAKPFGIAPMGGGDLACPGADRMLCTLAAQFQMPIGASTVATSSLEDYARWSKGAAWFQLYASGDGEMALGLAKRAEDAGYRVLVLTVDVPELGRRVGERRTGFGAPFRLTPQTFVDCALHPGWSLPQLAAGVPGLGNFTAQDAKRGFVWNRQETRGAVDRTWLRRLRAAWPGKLVVKGVLDVADALWLREEGVDAIQVSSHGGRQLNHAVQPIIALHRMRQALGEHFALFYDSGMRHGEDVLKALALGADFVFIGRPWLFAAAAQGRQGLDALYDCFSDELDIAMAMCGLRSLHKVPKSIIETQGELWPSNI